MTKPAEEGGLGFDYKWDMGWMNDTLDYFRTAPEYRTRDYHKLTFSMMYYYDERYLLPLSHDEVVHGKATILQKMYGDYGQKFLRQERFICICTLIRVRNSTLWEMKIGHFREWDEKGNWTGIFTHSRTSDFHRFMEDLNHFYLEHPALSDWITIWKDFSGWSVMRKKSASMSLNAARKREGMKQGKAVIK